MGATAVTPRTRPPAVTRRPPASRLVPECRTATPSGSVGGIQIRSPVVYDPGYPLALTTTQIAHPARSSSRKPDSRRLEAAQRSARRSVASLGSTACVSGSPKRVLNSRTLGPFAVSMIPMKSVPQKSIPSPAIASTEGRTIVRSISPMSSGVTTSAGEYAPIPPVLGPVSPSPILLWSWEVGRMT